MIYRYCDNAGGWLTASTWFSTSSVNPTSGSWVRIGGTTTVPAGATAISLSLRRSTGTQYVLGDTLDGTGLMIVKDANLYNFGYGNSAGWAWSGVANNSTSFGPPL